MACLGGVLKVEGREAGRLAEFLFRLHLARECRLMTCGCLEVVLVPLVNCSVMGLQLLLTVLED
jgi:hypothetical protein